MWVCSPNPTWWKKRANICKLSSDLREACHGWCSVISRIGSGRIDWCADNFYAFGFINKKNKLNFLVQAIDIFKICKIGLPWVKMFLQL
ncbi:rCG37970 [Rattus norvegicus]|uniref:RCG37970 n=1 Tax=Rattus norvegicus TaxID=10116 RepID=A6K5S8_RAT|nr:rCG37970 [Rattus norvegicus]